MPLKLLNMRTAYFLIIFVIVTNNLFAQKILPSKIKFGHVTLEDFAPKVYSIDSNAQAVVLFDKGSANYVPDQSGWFNIEYVYHKKIRILNKNQFDRATVEIPLYKGNNHEDKVEKIEAVTYNMENNEIVSTKMDKESIFNDKASKNYSVKKFTLPNLKEGCIIEYTYTIISQNAYNLRNWVFQDKVPVLQSEYEITLPTLFDFIFLPGGYYELKPETEQGFKNFNILNSNGAGKSEIGIYKATTNHVKWSLSNLKPMVKEKFTTTLQNHISKIEFQLQSINYPESPPKPYMQTWSELVKTLLKDEQFGADLSGKNNWMNDEVKNLIKGDDALSNAKSIYSYLRDNFTCTDYDALYLPENLKKSFASKKGNIAEINLLLVAMLKKAQINADPVLLSTTDNGKAFEMYPLINKFNYVIARVIINNKIYLLDASRKKLGFNYLPQYCYNGYGRLINETPYVVDLFADSLMEKKVTSIFISNSENGKNILGSFNSNLGYYESYNFREDTKDNEIDNYFKKIKDGFGYDIILTNNRLDSLKNPDERLNIGYDFSFNFNEDIVYLNPLFGEAYKSNPFTAATRNYPVEMPYKTEEVIVVNMEIPKGYKIDEMPKSTKMKYNEDEGLFEYIMTKDATNIYLKCVLKFNKAIFSPEDYESLREFYGHIVKKQSEQIVFKKIN